MLRWTWISIVIIFLDQFTKWMAVANLEKAIPVPISSFLNMTLYFNEGAAFSFLASEGGWQRWFFTILTIVVSLFILNWLRILTKQDKWTAIGLALVLGGAIGNLIDRMLMGKVTDFIAVHFPVPFVTPDYHFAIFNVADMGITLGAMLLIFISLFGLEDMGEKKTTQSAENLL